LTAPSYWIWKVSARVGRHGAGVEEGVGEGLGVVGVAERGAVTLGAALGVALGAWVGTADPHAATKSRADAATTPNLNNVHLTNTTQA
jgi:hypothetical protein